MKKLYIGLMSGTSLDGVDIAIVEFSSKKPVLISSLYKPYPIELLTDLKKACQQARFSFEALGKLDARLGDFYGQCIQESMHSQHIKPKDIAAIGSHGQSIHHSPDSSPPFTLQIGDAHRIADKTGIPVIADFRRRDIAAGGQGAPLVPAFHQFVFQSSSDNIVILNIGGISNISVLHKAPSEAVIGFDCGPGNTLMDQWCQQHFDKPYDSYGQLAEEGTIDAQLLNSMLDDPYFKQKYPKSTGPERFNLKWLEAQLGQHQHCKKDVLSTLCELTAQCISQSIRQLSNIDKVLVCGGGTHNKYLMGRLTNLIDQPVETTEQYGIHPDWVEAMAFAWLAKQTMEGKPGNMPSVTGAKKAVILGSIYPT